ncbi:MAG: anaerobic sulfatase maturase [Alphaproteobacteria bacterium]|nr:anaerobic sulfatase maturase [Alphaproteobacteria bacterium]
MPDYPVPRIFHMMAKPTGPRCNINCSYCYYLEKDALYPREKKFRMSRDVLDAYIRQMIDAATGARQNEVLFAWHGGEPMLAGLDFYRKAVVLQHKYAPSGMQVLNTMQTNATLINEDWARFLAEHDFLMGVSVDGPRAVHDRYRLDRAGRPTFTTTLHGLDLLLTHGVEVNLLTVVHRHNAGKARAMYRFLRGLGTAHLQFIPIVERATEGGKLAAAPQVDMDPANAVTPWSVSPRAYGKFLCDIFDMWFRKDVGRLHIQYFEEMLGTYLGRPASLCIYAETCGNALVMEHNGDVYACDHFVYPEFRQGNIKRTSLATLARRPEMQQFGQNKKASLTKQCRTCTFRLACNGGCPKHRFLTARDGEPGQSYFCESYTMFFRHAGERLGQMAALLRQRRPASDIYRGR